MKAKMFRISQQGILAGFISLLFFIPHYTIAQGTVITKSAYNQATKCNFEIPSTSGVLSDPNQLNTSTHTFGNGAGITVRPDAPEGNQVAFFNPNNAYVERTFTVNSNRYFRVLVKAALRTSSHRKDIIIYIDNIKLGQYHLKSTTYEELISLPIFLSAGNHTIRIQGTNTHSNGVHVAYIDDIRLQRVQGWNESNTWQNGVVPTATDHVLISSDAVVALPNNATVKSIRAEGQLLAAQNTDIALTCKYLLVTGSAATLKIGQKTSPYLRNATITLNAHKSELNSNDPQVRFEHMGTDMGTKFLGAMGGAIIDLHGASKTSWTRLEATVNPADTEILVSASNWNIGDEIVIVSSTNDWEQAEKREIVGITTVGNNKRIQIDSSFSYKHVGEVRSYSSGTRNWNADFRAEVGMLTHNIKIQGDANSMSNEGFGGHVMIMTGAKAYFSHIELYLMGQKGILGRYPFHWHLLGIDGEGQYLESSSIHHSFNRAITIHGTHLTKVDKNVCYDHIGHGVFLEDGSEEDNLIRANLVLSTKLPEDADKLTPSEDAKFNDLQNSTPASFWITNPKNKFHNNVAAGTQGTGFWFIFPQSPIGASANDPRFAGIEPYKNPLTLFKRNCAHSCSNGFDIFDHLTTSHDIFRNGGWEHSGIHLIENCTWYANKLAIYTGTGRKRVNNSVTDNLIFRNNILAENQIGTMFAGYSILESSLIVARTGLGLRTNNEKIYAYNLYDGAGQVHHSYFYNWNTSNRASLFTNTGAGTKHPNHHFVGNTTNDGIPSIALSNFDLPPAYKVGSNSLRHPRVWSMVIRDVDGGISGQANSSIVSNHPFLVTDPSSSHYFQHPNWLRAYRTDYKYALVDMSYNMPNPDNPNVIVTRSGTGTPDASVFYIGGHPDSYREHHQLPLIVNEDFIYTYEYDSLPKTNRVNILMDDAEAGDFCVIRFRHFAHLNGLVLEEQQVSLTPAASLQILKNNAYACYYNDGEDIYVKIKATGKTQNFLVKWTSVGMNYPSTAPDTDGDLMPDRDELKYGRHPFYAGDLAEEFNYTLTQIPAYSASFDMKDILPALPNGASAQGVSIGANPRITNRNFSFKASEVTNIEVRMKASAATAVELYFGTDSNPGFSHSRVFTQSYNGNNVDPNGWTTLTFSTIHANWNGIIEELRLDPVDAVGVSFEIDYIRANGAVLRAVNNTTNENKAKDKLLEENINKLILFPNPVSTILTIDGITNNIPFQIIDVAGRIVKTGQTEDNTVDVQALPSGSYWIRLNNENHPFVKQ